MTLICAQMILANNRGRAVRMMIEHRGEYKSESDAICAISSKTGCHCGTLRAWLRQQKIDLHGDISPTRTDGGGLAVDER